MKDDFYVDDESLDEVRRAWDSGERVLVIPSRLRRQLRQQAEKLRQVLGVDRRRSAQHAKAQRAQRGEP